MNEHVGYGRNIGDGSDAENQQTTDELGRYTDESDAFSNEIKIENSDGRYDSQIRESFNKAYSGGSPEYRNALDALNRSNPFSIDVREDKGCSYNPVKHCIFLNAKDIENDGNPYYRLPQILEHESSHAIDFAIWNRLGSFRQNDLPASGYLRLPLMGNMTMLEIAESELGDLDDEFQQMVLEEQNKEIKIEKPKEIDPYAPQKRLADLLSKAGGFDYDETLKNVKDVRRILENPFAVDPKFMMATVQLLNDPKIKGELEDMIKEQDDYLANMDKQYERFKKISFDRAVELQREYGALNDLMSAANRDPEKRGRNFSVLGSGHFNEYYMITGNRATEIFAQIGPILSFCPKAAKWLKEKAPKTMDAYYELLRIASEELK